MASVTARTANWRLFGGSALVIAAVLWLIALLVSSQPWMAIIVFLLLAAAFVIIAFGQTGGNGAVGKYVPGKVALVVYAAGWALLALGSFVAIPTILAGLAIIVGGLVSAWAINSRSVAKGAARWILFVPAVIGAIWALQLIGIAVALPFFFTILLALAFAAAGVLYLLNDRKLG